MSAFFIVSLTVKDAEKFKEYGQKASQSLQRYNAEFIIKGQHAGDLAGNSSHSNVAVVKFADMATLEEWYASDEYQAIIPLRELAADVTISKYAIPA